MTPAQLCDRARALGFTHYKTAGGLAPLADFAPHGPYGAVGARCFGPYDGTLVLERENGAAIRDAKPMTTYHGPAYACWPLVKNPTTENQAP